MEKTVQDIYTPVADEMLTFKRFFKDSLLSQEPLLRDVTEYLSQSEGKQLRPLLVLLSAKMHGEICSSTYIAATAIEMVHTATLIHDDVVDSSDERRGRRAVHVAWTPQVAILAGDYLLSKALHITTENSEFELLKLVTQSVKEMSEGELVQLAKAQSLDTTEEDYLNIIYKKTASLISACAATGARSVGKDDNCVNTMKKVGKNIGLAFQIRDDIFDYESNNLIGKPVGNDIKEHKLTLPLIYALKKADDKTREYILNCLQTNNNEAEKIAEIVSFVRKSGGVEYAEEVMQRYCDEATMLLQKYEESEARNALLEFVQFTAFRKS